MQTPKEIAALIESGRVEVLCHGKYQPYDILPKYGAHPIDSTDTILVVKSIPDTPNGNTQTHFQT